jgi:hypothetical protein
MGYRLPRRILSDGSRIFHLSSPGGVKLCSPFALFPKWKYDGKVVSQGKVPTKDELKKLSGGTK